MTGAVPVAPLTTIAATKEVDEAELIARAQRDPRAFAPLYARYADPVYRYCYRRLGSEDAAADATSAVFAKALAAMPRYRAGSFRSWLFVIAHNTVVDGLRSRRFIALPELADDSIDPGPAPEEIAVSADAGRELRTALARLPNDQRRVMEFRLADMSDREIAESMGRSVGAIRQLQVRAVVRLRALLAPCSGECGGSHGS